MIDFLTTGLGITKIKILYLNNYLNDPNENISIKNKIQI